MADLTAQADIVSSSSSLEIRTARRIATRLLWILDRVRFRLREYTGMGISMKRDDSGLVVIRVPRAELISRLSPDRSKKLKSKRSNIDELALRLVQNPSVLAYLGQVM